MTVDPASNSQATGPAAQSSSEMAESCNGATPGDIDSQPSGAKERSQLSQARDTVLKAAAAINKEMGKLEEELGRANSRMDNGTLHGPDREKVRQLRDGLRQRLSALKEDQVDGERRLAHLDLLLHGDTAENALATRRGTQGAALVVADQIRGQIAQVAELWQRFQVLRLEDEQLRDVVRSFDQARMTEVTTFSWTTGVDQAFASAIAEVISQSHRSTRDLLARSPVSILR